MHGHQGHRYHPYHSNQQVINTHYKLQSGKGLPYFEGSRYQKGYGLGSLLAGAFKAAVPLLKTTGKTLGKQAIQTGINIAKDVAKGRNLKSSVISNVKRIPQEVVHALTNSDTRQKRKRKAQPQLTGNKRNSKRRKKTIFD